MHKHKSTDPLLNIKNMSFITLQPPTAIYVLFKYNITHAMHTTNKSKPLELKSMDKYMTM